MARKNSGLAWILQEAKKLRDRYPNRFETWKEYVAQATAIYHSKHGDAKPKTGHKTKSVKTRREKTATKKRRRGIVTRGPKLRSTGAKLRKKLKSEGQRLPQGYELAKLVRASNVGDIGRLTVKQLREYLRNERARLKHGYQLAKRKMAGIAGIGAVTKSEIQDLVKHYEHVYQRMELAAIRADTWAEKERFRHLANEIKKHLYSIAEIVGFEV